MQELASLVLVALLLVAFLLDSASAFVVRKDHSSLVLFATTRRYGPPLGDDFFESPRVQKEKDQTQAREFRSLLDKVLTALESDRPEHIPSLLTKHAELLLRMPGHVVTELVQEALQNDNTDKAKVEEALEMIVSFVEDFVEQSKQLDDQHKQLLGKIIRTMTTLSKSQTERQREESLDQFLQEHRHEFTRGFLRHLEGECDRIQSAPSVTPDSLKLKETLLVIHARILEEMAVDCLGEGALVLGQLIAYDDKIERIAVLEAGLQVRGVEFAQELAALTQEALEGFQQQQVDPDLVTRVQEIDQRVQEFVEENGTFQ
ncbi:expressed unknown protein [Seminavis robusta]|uniref:Uncharacterized protein n=1 Tax=Seminavis robusta TaxID=568900 RepID=A0A9N8HA09_9STRA|nr:expressed unknown protein [Seminavis robusta]|eukprot:Sro133_g062880.1 n/a (317) ;mRNA; r:14266-15216